MYRKNFLSTATLFLISIVFTYSPMASMDVVSPADAGYDAKKLNEIKDVLDPLYEDGRIPNYVVLLAKDGKIFYSAIRGNTNVNGSRPVDKETAYYVASMTKPIVSSVVFALIDEGKLSLDDTLNSFFPIFDDLFVAPGGSFDSAFEELDREITVLDLITHTSGFTYGESIIGLGDVAKQYDEIGVMSQERSLNENLEILAEVPLVAQPGTSFNYSVGIDLLAAILEKIEGKRLGDILNERFFEPMDMKNIGFGKEDFSDGNNIAWFYGAPRDGVKPIGKIEDNGISWKIAGLPFAPEPGLNRQFDNGGGGIWSSAEDYLKFASLLGAKGLWKGSRILNEETVAKQTTNLVPGLGLEAFEAQFGNAASMMSFGGGLGIKRESASSDTVDYYFWGGICNTAFWIDPIDGSSGIFLTHHCPGQYNVNDELEQIIDDARL